MPSQKIVVTLTLLFGSCCINASPVYPESNSAQDFMLKDFNLADGAVGFVADSKHPAGLQPPKNLNQALSAVGEGVIHDQKSARSKGTKRPLQDDVPNNLVEDLDEVLWKMVAVRELQSQGLTQTDQASQQPSKRACFWKYCVTK